MEFSAVCSFKASTDGLEVHLLYIRENIVISKICNFQNELVHELGCRDPESPFAFSEYILKPGPFARIPQPFHIQPPSCCLRTKHFPLTAQCQTPLLSLHCLVEMSGIPRPGLRPLFGLSYKSVSDWSRETNQGTQNN